MVSHIVSEWFQSSGLGSDLLAQATVDTQENEEQEEDPVSFISLKFKWNV